MSIVGFAIGEWLTVKQKATIVNQRYEECEGIWSSQVDGEDCCPLGLICLGSDRGWPRPFVVADTLISQRPSLAAHRDEILRAAAAFMRAWDRGVIRPDQLAAALGLEEAA
jgi:hypothetical protein